LDADDREIRPRRDDTGKTSVAARRLDHDLQPALSRRGGPFHDAFRIAMGRADLDLVRQFQLVENFDARLHQRQI
jgi:hypothetical protein